jgi:hypothetical protein
MIIAIDGSSETKGEGLSAVEVGVVEPVASFRKPIEDFTSPHVLGIGGK